MVQAVGTPIGPAATLPSPVADYLVERAAGAFVANQIALVLGRTMQSAGVGNSTVRTTDSHSPSCSYDKTTQSDHHTQPAHIEHPISQVSRKYDSS